VAPGAAVAAGSPPAATEGVASSWDVVSTSRGAASGSGPPGRAPTDAGGDGGAAGVVANLSAVVDGAGWGRDPPAGDSPEGAEVVAGQVVLARIIKVRIQKLNGAKKNMRS
jgi:hypothetical protein